MAYTDTTGELARDAKVAAPTVRKYADLGLLDHVIASNGVRLFQTGQAARVKAIYKEHLARRGRRAP